MEFTTGLMSLDTALNEMLSRVTPLTSQKRRHWYSVLVVFSLASDVVSPLTFRGLITHNGRYAVRLADTISSKSCLLPVNPLPVSRTMVNGLRVPAFVL